MNPFCSHANVAANVYSKLVKLLHQIPEQESTEVKDEAVVVPTPHVDNCRLLTPDFYACDALDLAPRLLGKLLRHEDVILQITEVGAHLFPARQNALQYCFP